MTVTPATLLLLQQSVQVKGIPFGSAEKVPPDRTVLQNVPAAGAKFSEGMLVRMAAFIIETHYADLSSGESVNCDVKEDTASNDIHMALGTAYGADECTSVTVEITPHFRPKAWNAIAGIEAKGKTSKPAPITQHPIRVTGQLFFDASHKPCSNGKPEMDLPRGNRTGKFTRSTESTFARRRRWQRAAWETKLCGRPSRSGPASSIRKIVTAAAEL